MAKTKNPLTSRLAIGDRVSYRGKQFGTLVARRQEYPSFGVQFEGRSNVTWFYRDQIKWVEPLPTEPEPYEAWFV